MLFKPVRVARIAGGWFLACAVAPHEIGGGELAMTTSLDLLLTRFSTSANEANTSLTRRPGPIGDLPGMQPCHLSRHGFRHGDPKMVNLFLFSADVAPARPIFIYLKFEQTYYLGKRKKWFTEKDTGTKRAELSLAMASARRRGVTTSDRRLAIRDRGGEAPGSVENESGQPVSIKVMLRLLPKGLHAGRRRTPVPKSPLPKSTSVYASLLGMWKRDG